MAKQAGSPCFLAGWLAGGLCGLAMLTCCGIWLAKYTGLFSTLSGRLRRLAMLDCWLVV